VAIGFEGTEPKMSEPIGVSTYRERTNGREDSDS
jgi:hypothetical protein